MIFADILLPVPLDGLFTYSVPAEIADAVRFGVRVLVPFGPKTKHVGIVIKTHDKEPEGITVRDILRVLDTESIITNTQYALWKWISEYYMAPIGDVYKAALPSGLKAEDGYKPRTELYVRLRPEFCSQKALHIALDMLARADKQKALFETYLSLSHWADAADSGDHSGIVEVTREELLNASNTNVSVAQSLIKRGIIETYTRNVGRLNTGGEPDYGKMKVLGQPQQAAYDEILKQFESKNVVLLHGVTSSGKTEIYIHLIKQAIDRHQQVLYLLPEIALTVQITERLRRVFGNKLGIYHSRYSDDERVEIWRKQLSADPYDVILGARSAVLLPFSRLGLVIVDEEHEQSFKQQDPAPRYHARSTAIMLAQMCRAKTLLGTATPSMETYHNAMTGKYGMVRLTQRYKGIELPEIRVVDVKDLRHRKIMRGPLSPLLLVKMREAIENGRQAILFQNRRGFAPMIECQQCGWVPRCERCDVSLTLHRRMNQLTCHYCGATYDVPQVCPACGSRELKTHGYGTEKIEERVRDAFPEARVARMDLDTTRTNGAYERIIDDFAAGRTDVLIGTQMIGKGLDFDRVSVVGILDADSMMNYPDFRAYEQAFMMMAQVSGRAGRKGGRGLVILQTKSPDSSLIAQVAHNDYGALYRDLAAERQAFGYPPYTHLIYVYMKHRDDKLIEHAATEMGSMLRRWFGERVLGPDKPAVARVKMMSIRKIVLKLELGIDMYKVRQYLYMVQKQLTDDKRFRSVLIYFDVDPL